MNGVSHMLPFVVGGGILIAIAFLIDGLCVDVGALTAEQRSNFGTITQAAALFKGIGGVAFGFMLPVLAGYIGMAIGDRPALAVGFVGGMMAANGKSGFLGALVAGFAAGYIILGLKKLCVKLPETIEKLTPVLIYPVAGILIIGLLMQFIVEPVMGGINTGLNSALTGMSGTSKIALGFILGGMMAVDMGGPFNKAAYVFGTASIIAGNYDIMAAVMIGGMTPPCAIALATMLFPNKFTKQEREAGPTNFIMGLAFITEGAIPYAASDPLACHTGMCHWFGDCRSNVYGIQMYTDGTARRHLCRTGNRESVDVSDCTGCRNGGFNGVTRSIKEKGKIEKAISVKNHTDVLIFTQHFCAAGVTK